MTRHLWTMPVVTLAALLLTAAAPTSTTTISDPCGGGLFPRADICAVTIAVDLAQHEDPEGGPSLSLDSVTFEMLVDGSFEDRLPTDIWEIAWVFDGCLWGVRWFHDPGTDTPGELSTRLDRECDDGFTGIELDPPAIAGSTISSTVSAADLQELDPTVEAGGVLERVGATTYSGVGVQTDVYGYSQASYEHDDTERANVPLTP